MENLIYYEMMLEQILLRGINPIIVLSKRGSFSDRWISEWSVTGPTFKFEVFFPGFFMLLFMVFAFLSVNSFKIINHYDAYDIVPLWTC